MHSSFFEYEAVFPGEAIAVSYGCLCPMAANGDGHGNGTEYAGCKGWYIHPDCPMHGDLGRNREVEEAQKETEELKAELSGAELKISTLEGQVGDLEEELKQVREELKLAGALIPE